MISFNQRENEGTVVKGPRGRLPAKKLKIGKLEQKQRDATNKILYYQQERFTNYGVNTASNTVLFSGANAVSGADSSASGTPSSTSSETVDSIAFSSGYANPEMHPDSGDIIYIENRRPISRASDQTEDVKIIVEF